MLAASIPAKFPIPFAANAGGSFVRAIPTTTGTPGAASLDQGFPPITFTPVGAGGDPPDGRDMNGILKEVTSWNQWQQAGGPIGYDGTFSAAISGYPIGALISSATLGQFWLSTVDGNTTDPDTGGGGWSAINLGLGSTFSTGDTKWRLDAGLQPGWVRANGLTVSKAGSGGTELASASAQGIFVYLYLNFSNTQCPVSGGRSGSNQAAALADFAAGKTIQLLDARGMGLMGLDTMGNSAAGRLSGVPFVSGNSSTAGSVAGENTHVLVTGEMAPHTHNYSSTSGTESASHVHTLTTTTGAENQTHTHLYIFPTFAAVIGAGTVNVATGSSSQPTTAESAPHTHGLTGTTGGESASHTHAVSGTTDSGTGASTAHNTVHLVLLGVLWLKL